MKGETMLYKSNNWKDWKSIIDERTCLTCKKNNGKICSIERTDTMINDPNAFKPITQNPIILDFSGCKYLGEIHKILKQKFGFPEYYGENWDALWDCLRYLWTNGENIHIQIHGFNSLNSELHDYCRTMLEIFDDVHKETPNVTFELIS